MEYFYELLNIPFIIQSILYDSTKNYFFIDNYYKMEKFKVLILKFFPHFCQKYVIFDIV